MSQVYFPEEGGGPIGRTQRGFNPLGPDRTHEDRYTPHPDLADPPNRKGNNKYGAAGTAKCRRCRSRKTKIHHRDFTSDGSVLSPAQTPTNLAMTV